MFATYRPTDELVINTYTCFNGWQMMSLYHMTHMPLLSMFVVPNERVLDIYTAILSKAHPQVSAPKFIAHQATYDG